MAIASAVTASAQNLITNGSFEDPVFSNPSLNGSPVVPGWTGIPFMFSGDNGDPWPSGAAEGIQFADAGNGSSFVIRQTFSVPAQGLASINWKATTSSGINSGSYRVELRSSPGNALLETETFTVRGGIAEKDNWDAESLALSSDYGAGNYTLSFQSVSTNGQDFFIDDVIATANTVSTISASEKYSWAANAGWVNFRPPGVDGVVVSEGFLSGLAYAANLGWINLGDGSPDNGFRYSNTDGSDSGVNLESDGRLTGLAWSANAGWLKFDWVGSSSSTRPKIDLITGEFKGFAYGANIGWLKLDGGGLKTDTLHCIDSDLDGLGDSWEFEHFGDLGSANATTDSDGDGDLDLDEYTAASDPGDVLDRADESFLSIKETQDPLPDLWVFNLTGRQGRVYQLYKSTDLLNWSEFGDPTVFTGTSVQSLFGGNVDDTAREFFRVIYSKPLQP